MSRTTTALMMRQAKRPRIQKGCRCCLCKQDFLRTRGRVSLNDHKMCCPTCTEALVGRKEEEEEKFCKDDNDDDVGCWSRHKRVVLELMKHRVYLYDCDVVRWRLMERRHVHPGVYDVIFGRFETNMQEPPLNNNDNNTRNGRRRRRPQEEEAQQQKKNQTFNILRKRTLRNSSCQIFYAIDANGQTYLRGKVLMEMPHPGIVPTEIEFCECGRFFQIETLFAIRMNGVLRRVQAITETMDLEWIPNDNVSSHTRYANRLRNEINTRHKPLLWLSRHLHMPECLTQIINEYVSDRPKTTFTVQEGDLWVTFSVRCLQRERWHAKAELILRKQKKKGEK